MDPLTHALLGACTAQAALASPKRDYVGRYPRRHLWLVGAVGGLLPDLDVLIRSASDPLLAIEFHRHFTHSLLFIPFGGLLAILPWLFFPLQRERWKLLWMAGMLGYATHGLLDACTNYGTHLLWPFSDARTAWHWITTIGPLLTLGLLVGLVVSVRRRAKGAAIAALVFAAAYVGIAAVQQDRAVDAQKDIAASRGHEVVRGEIFPTVGNPFIWRSLYEADGVLYTDRVRVMSGTQWKAGHKVALLEASTLPSELQAGPRIAEDFARFHYFSAGWVARAVGDPSIIGDARYSLSAEHFEPIWGVRFHPQLAQPTEWVDRTAQNRVPASALWAEISSNAEGYGPLPAALPPKTTTGI
jgi:inner membrane protein